MSGLFWETRTSWSVIDKVPLDLWRQLLRRVEHWRFDVLLWRHKLSAETRCPLKWVNTVLVSSTSQNRVFGEPSKLNCGWMKPQKGNLNVSCAPGSNLGHRRSWATEKDLDLDLDRPCMSEHRSLDLRLSWRIEKHISRFARGQKRLHDCLTAPTIHWIYSRLTLTTLKNVEDVEFVLLGNNHFSTLWKFHSEPFFAVFTLGFIELTCLHTWHAKSASHSQKSPQRSKYGQNIVNFHPVTVLTRFTPKTWWPSSF